VQLGVNSSQTHDFECGGCGDLGRIALQLDRANPERIQLAPNTPTFASPRVKDYVLSNATRSASEEPPFTIINLDPTFLVPDELLHQDMVFPWMQCRDLVQRAFRLLETGRGTDILSALGVLPNMKQAISLVLRAYNFSSRGRADLVRQLLIEFRQATGIEVLSPLHALSVVAQGLIAEGGVADVVVMIGAVNRTRESNPHEFQRMVASLRATYSADYIERHFSVLKDYLAGYDQFCQAWVHATTPNSAIERVSASTRDLRQVKSFYANAFEQLASGLVLPACLNNIEQGRAFDSFSQISLAQYVTSDKARRAACLEASPHFACLFREFDSKLRNGAAHQGLRLRAGTSHIIEFRTGDAKAWENITYADYLVRCNRILICNLKLLLLQLYIFGPETAA
jgi:hypothetical protein